MLFAAEFWEYTPSDEQLANMWPGMTVEGTLYLPDLVDQAVAAGFRPLRVQASNRDEWDEFESGLASGPEEWLFANEDHPEADAVRATLDANRAIWLRGARGVFGFAFLTLGVPPA